MSSSSNESRDLLKKAHGKLEAAEILFASGRFDDAVSRAYYGAFHAISAALLSRDLFFSSHGQVMGAFNREFVKTGVFPKEFSAMVQALFDDRQTGDYGLLTEIDGETAQARIGDAAKIIAAVEQFLKV